MKKVCLLLLLCLGFFTAKAQTYVASAELPATHFPLSESSQTVVIPMDNVKEALNAIEEGLYDQVFPAYTTIYFFDEDGEELNVPSSSPFGGSGLTAYTTAEGISVRVQAGVEFPQAVYHLGKMNNSTAEHEDLRVTAQYDFTILLSAGDSSEEPAGDYVASAELPATHFPLSESSQTVVIPMDNVKEALNAIEEGLYDQVFPAYTTIYFFDENGEELFVPSSSPFGGSGLTAYTTAEGISVRVAAGTEFPQAVYHLGKMNNSTAEHEDLRVTEQYNFTIQLSAGDTGEEPEGDYVASAELPATHFPMSDNAQTIVIPMDNVKEALNSIEEGLYDQVFPAYTNVYFFNEAGEELVVTTSVLSNLSAYTTADGLTVRVPAETEFDKAVYHLGKLNLETGEHEDLRLTEQYNFTIELSAGEIMPVVTAQSDAEESIMASVDDITPLREAAGERVDEVFPSTGAEFVLLDENSEVVEGVTATYNTFNGLYLTIRANTVVARGHYYLATVQEDGSHLDWREEGLELYLVLTVEAPLLSQYDAESIIIDTYTVSQPMNLDGYAESMTELLGEDLFNRTFTSGQTYKFRVIETGEIVPNVSLNLRTNPMEQKYFELLISSESVIVNNEPVQLTGFDWNIGEEGAAVDLDINIVLNLTISPQVLAGELPETHFDFTGDYELGEISLDELKAEWDELDTMYFTRVFVDGNVYVLTNDNGNMPNVELLYSEAENVLKVTCYDKEVAEDTYYLMDASGFPVVDLRDEGYAISIVFSVSDATGIADGVADNGLCVTGGKGQLSIDSPEAGTANVYSLTGQLVATATVDGKADIALPTGIYLVSLNGKTRKVVVE